MEEYFPSFVGEEDEWTILVQWNATISVTDNFNKNTVFTQVPLVMCIQKMEYV